MADLKGKVLTVLGPVDPADLGPTLTHEHIIINSSPFLKQPEYGSCCYDDLEFEMRNLGKITHFPYSVKTNLMLDNEEEAISELKLFKQAGGGTLCDVTTVGIRSKPECLPKIARETGLNVVTGTGYYVNSFLPGYAKHLSTHEMADTMLQEIREGIGSTGVRCGLIGEIGCSYPLQDSEKRALQAAAMVQQQSGAPLIIHPGREDCAPFEIVTILESHGADLTRTVMSHLDRTIFDEKTLLSFAEMGCIMEFDLFGIECSHFQNNVAKDMPSDAQRIAFIKLLVDKGLVHRVLIAQDIHTKHRLVKYGGHGYAHIMNHILPKMADRGIGKEDIDIIIRENPKQWLTFC